MSGNQMTIRIIQAAISLVVLAGPAFGPVMAAENRRPNVLFLFTDDQRPDAIAALGNPAIKTPNMDSLARQGLVFRNAYIFGSDVGAVCRPSRNMLLSGRTYFRWSGPYAPADQPNFPASMKQAGYFTYHHGKKGNNAVLIQKLFDVDKYVDEGTERKSGEPGKSIVDEAIVFLKDRRADKPFFMYLAFGNPHDPRVADQKYLDLYHRDKIPLPKNYMPLHPFDNGEMVIRDELLAPWPRTEDEIRRQLHEYYAVISGLDRNVGRLLTAVKQLGLSDNTIIIYSSDNGLAVGSHGLMGKQSLYDHSAKVPLIMVGPGIPRGSSDALVYLMDIFPTICEMTGTAIPDGLDGTSLKPVIDKKAESVRDSIFMSYGNCQRGIREERFKLIRYPLINKTQLFDLQADPDELHNLADDTGQNERIDKMMAELAQWQKRLGDKAPLTAADPHDAKFTPPTGDQLDALLGRWKMK
ncbi:MAG: sulfatase-like hydrolase/transferase [Planctomycetes bacterium]|nr:sulfatase-like hydrolase/transferase [Planctomycetota bacterium]